MTTKQSIFGTVLIVLIGTIFASNFSSTFPIGTYSYIGNKNHVYDYREAFCAYMHDLGYNTNVMEVFSPGGTTVTDYGDLYNELFDNGVDAIIMDKRWDATNQYSTHALSTGSYQRFEAEYTDGGAVGYLDNLKSQYWYRSRSDTWATRVGKYDQNSPGVWQCNRGEHSPGCAYTDLKYRWNTVSNDSIRIGKEFYIKKLLTPDSQNYVYVTYVFSISNVTPNLNSNSPLLAFRPGGFPYGNGGHLTTENQVLHFNYANNSTGYVTQFKYGDYTALGSPTVGIPVTIKISYSELANKNLLGNTSDWWKQKLVNLNPRLFWYGNCDLKLDYIEIEDQIFHDMKVDNGGVISMDPDVASQMTSQLSSLYPSNHPELVTGLYTLDEPSQPLWKAYKMIQDETSSSAPMMSAAYDTDFRKYPLQGTTDKFFDVIDAFISVSNPNIIMPDIYPLKPGYNDWNSDNMYSLQWYLDHKLLNVYRKSREYASDNDDRMFYPIVAAFGYWDKTTWVSWMLPPPAMQKMLQLIPLCYQPDGIFNYRLFGYQSVQVGTSIVVGEYAPLLSTLPVNDIPTFPDRTEDELRFGDDNLSRSEYSAPFVLNPTYNAIKEANAKVAVYGQLLKSYTWTNADSIMVDGYHPDFTISSMLLSGLSVQANTGEYDGYVQCGYYHDEDNPVFMVVNRRANYFNTANMYNHSTPNVVPEDHYPNCFPAANSQVVDFALDTEAYIQYGTYPALYDPYDKSILGADDEIVSVTLEPGDGKLLQMCSSLPEVVSDSYVIKKKGILSGEIVLEQGGIVSVEAGTELTIKAGSQITITSGASFTFRGEVTIEDGVTIKVEENGIASFNSAVCKWGEGSALIVEAGFLEINGGSFASTDPTATRWTGFSAINSSVVTINNSTISDAFRNYVTNSHLNVSNTTFTVPANSYGLNIINNVSGYETTITNTEEGKGFYGVVDANSKGLTLGAMRNTAIIHNVRFHNLLTGLAKTSIIGERDSIAYCNFSNCIDGIKILSSDYYGRIQNCVFSSNNTGIKLTAAIPYINNCSFINNTLRGILSEYSIFTIGIENGIYNSNFNNNPIGLESRGSNHRIETSYFSNNVSALINHGGSNLSMANNANNVFRNQISNIEFCDYQPYEATIQLLNGHNDFYHQDAASFDFAFDSNYYAYPYYVDKIDASNNWFEEETVVINDVAYTDYVVVESFDSEPNMPPPPFDDDRISIAMNHEAQGEYGAACEEYAAILNDPLESELRYLPIAADGVFRYAVMMTDPDWVTTEFFDDKAIQYEIDNPALSALLEEYLAKTFILNEDYQSAIDQIQQRIDEPSNPIDSLLAVLDLEIVLHLASLEETKKPITTKYTQYKYPNIQVFDSKHDEHWAKLYALMDKGDGETGIPIPPIPQISSNYPNPFNPSTTIAFSIPNQAATKLTVYNLKGQKVKEILSSDLAKGHHKVVWDGKDSNNRNVSTGIYFIKLDSGGKTSLRKAMLMK